MRLRPALLAPLGLLLGMAVTSCGGGEATATNPPAAVMMVAGDDQQATVGTDAAEALKVMVFDAKGQPASGVTVTWAVVQGTATLTPASATTSILGEAQVVIRLGTTAGTVRITATVGSLPAVAFTLTALPLAPARIDITSGDNQTGTVNVALAASIVARVVDATGAPYAGATVAFAPANGGQATPATVTTNANGEASTSWRLGTTAGAQTLAASVANVPTVTFHATGTAGAPAQVGVVSGNDQTNTVGQKLVSPVVMLVRDAWNNPVSGASVAFAATAGGGSFAPASVATGADGRASAEWTLGPANGTNSGTATVTGAGIAPAALTATATPPLYLLAHRVVDAEFSAATNRIVSVSANPSRLNIIDPETQVVQSVDLPQVPTSVAVQPNGLFAAVGHNGFISYVNLTTRVVDRVYTATTDVLDIVLPGNGFVYAFPRADQWEEIHSIALASGAETLTGTIYAGTLARMHPSGKFIYGANNGLSPSDFEKYGIGTSSTAGTAATYLYDSPYHGDYAFNGNVWVSEDGLRLFARSGNAFRASEVRAEDMTYGGSLQGMSAVQWVAQSTAAARVFALPGATNGAEGASELRVYESAFLAYRGASVLPRFNVPAVGSYAARGRFVFPRADGARIYVLLQADPTSGLPQDWGLVIYPVAELP
jgi:hypothetical protein